MDKWLTLDQVAKRLNIHEHDLLDLGMDGKITFHWLPNGFDQMGIDIAQIELTTITGLDGEKYEGWKRVKDSKVIQHEFGPFLIDTTIDDRWSLILDAIKNKFNVRDDCVFGFDDNFRFKYLDHIYKAYFDDPLIVYLPRASELNIRSSELDRYKKQLKRIKSLPKPDGINKQRKAAYKKYLDETNQWHRLNEDNTGNDGLKDEIFNVLKNQKANDGSDLISHKPIMKKSWEGFKNENKNIQIK
jgi:hypothetical protein